MVEVFALIGATLISGILVFGTSWFIGCMADDRDFVLSWVVASIEGTVALVIVFLFTFFVTAGG